MEYVKVNYKLFWKLLIDKKVSKIELRKRTKIASSTISKMTNNQHVSLDVLARIAIVLECDLDDIVKIEK